MQKGLDNALGRTILHRMRLAPSYFMGTKICIGDVDYDCDIEFTGWYHSAPAFYNKAWGNWEPPEEDGDTDVQYIDLWVDDEMIHLEYWQVELIPQLLEAVEADPTQYAMIQHIIEEQ
jgi:hypothetical protein